jgi:hypothetical protein
MSEFSDGNGTSLKGAYITLEGWDISSDDGDDNPPAPGDSLEIRIESGEDEVVVMTAAAGEGLGQWDFQPRLADTKLHVSDQATIGSHSATLTWILSAAPQDE